MGKDFLDRPQMRDHKLENDETDGHKEFLMNFGRSIIFTSLTAILFSITGTVSSIAQDSTFTLAPVPTYKSQSGKFVFKLRGRVYWDYAVLEDDDDNQDGSPSEFRTARTGLDASMDKFSARLELDHSGGNTRFTDLYISWKGPVEVKLGQFKIETSLEEATSSRYTTFMERASFTDAFSFARQLGISLAKGGNNWHLKLGLQKGSTATGFDDATFALSARATYSPKLNNTQTHLGLSLRYRETAGSQGDFAYAQRAYSHLSNKYLATGAITDSDLFIGIEAAVLWGPLSLQGEYGRLNASLSTPAAGQKDPTFSGAYISGSWYITGENRNYNPEKGGFGRTVVNSPVHKGGIGAWQVAIRYDIIDLSKSTILGGEQATFIFGLNWHLNRWSRLMLNYSHASINNAQLVALNGTDGINAVNSFGIRTQINW